MRRRPQIGYGRFCSRTTMNKPWGLFRSLLALAPVLVLVPLVSYRAHYCKSRALPHYASHSSCSLANSCDITVSLRSSISSLSRYRSSSFFFSAPCRTDPATGLPQISESKILGYAKYLSEDIGYRTVGTKEHAIADAWLLKETQLIAEQCPEGLECEVWRQSGSGSHRYVIDDR